MRGMFEKIELKEQEINMYVRILKNEENSDEISKLLKKIGNLEGELHIMEQGLKYIDR